MQVVDAPGVRVAPAATGAQVTDVRSGSATRTFARLTLPVLLTTMEYLTTCPAAVAVVGLTDFVIV